MKNTHFFYFLFLGLNISFFVKAANPTDTASIKCSYQFRYLNDSVKSSYNDDELYVVLIGKSLTKAYSYRTFVRDSIASSPSAENELVKKVNEYIKDPANIGKVPSFIYRGDFPAYLYKDYTKEKIIVTDNISSYYFVYEDELSPQNWTILGDTMTILGYSCQKAQCSFRGREWEAWFAADIPVSEGPWKFSGLPGLIMMLKDTQSHYSFEMKGLQQVNEPIFMDISKKTTKIGRISFLKLLMGAKGKEIVAMDLAKVGITPNTSTGKKYDYIELDYK
ncbi:MAG: GLPGLI family protein [Dysgonamonadaceae bacterium]|jgi:GLPGLI family protein|nr:GLPGLI family protein [Dysgonamonadaceae bacterium]